MNEIHSLMQRAKKYLKQVRFILLTNKSSKSGENLLDKLLDHPIRLKGLRPLTREEIYVR